MEWQNMREEEFEGAVKESGKVCIVPIGCVEKHGQHLPVGIDTQVVNQICIEAAKKEPVVVFPPIYFGDVMGHTIVRGGIMFSAELLLQLLKELTSEIARNGFKKIIFVSGHGGNPPMLSYFVRSTQHSAKDYVVAWMSPRYTVKSIAADLDKGEEFPELTEEDKEFLRDFAAKDKLRGHACIDETSSMLALHPELVAMDRVNAESGLPTHRTDYLKETGLLASTRFWGIEYPNSYQGEAVEGSNERIGKVLFRKRSDLLAETCRLLKMDDRILEWNDEWNKRSEWCKPTM